MKPIRNIDQLRAEQLKRSLKRARLGADLHHQWQQVQHQPPNLLSLLGWTMHLLTRLLRKRERHWTDFFKW
ncbi:hypothetical protein [Paraflavitalea pollutisoli]|uniref:hypothetical protein n=1 Tax=Paraflavitalea pollutisoli TaxID=3034143 RepID=UPI0023EAB1CF|nr:hypothetical protein [Paraflavitalea sp. H1-2-19X]